MRNTQQEECFYNSISELALCITYPITPDLSALKDYKKQLTGVLNTQEHKSLSDTNRKTAWAKLTKITQAHQTIHQQREALEAKKIRLRILETQHIKFKTQKETLDAHTPQTPILLQQRLKFGQHIALIADKIQQLKSEQSADLNTQTQLCIKLKGHEKNAVKALEELVLDLAFQAKNNALLRTYQNIFNQFNNGSQTMQRLLTRYTIAVISATPEKKTPGNGTTARSPLLTRQHTTINEPPTREERSEHGYFF